MFKKIIKKIFRNIHPHPFKPNSPYATVENIVFNIKKTGVARNDINGKHLTTIYKQLTTLESAPDFSFLNIILPIDQNQTSNNEPLWGVILETRKLPSLEIVINNVNTMLGIPIQLYHGLDNYEFIMSSTISELIKEGKVKLTSLNTHKINASQYNALLLSNSFWGNVIGRNKILIFQTDAILCPCSKYKINDFIHYDYIGSQWNRNRPIGIKLDGGNGGLSLRDWNKTTECINRFPPHNWVGGEDGYFALHLDIMGANVGRGDMCAKFSTQDDFLFNSLGAHKISELRSSTRKNFLSYCPEAKYIL